MLALACLNLLISTSDCSYRISHAANAFSKLCVLVWLRLEINSHLFFSRSMPSILTIDDGSGTGPCQLDELVRS